MPPPCRLSGDPWLPGLLLALLLASAAAAPCRMPDGAAHGSCGLPYELSNFQGNEKCDPSVRIGRPRDWSQLAALVRAFPQVKASGVGHSWWSGQFCAGTNASAINVVTTEFDDVLRSTRTGDLSRLVAVDERARTVTAPAGITQRALLEFLAGYRTAAAPEGYTLGSFSWFIDQTLGGAVSTGSHGSSLQYGSLSNQLKAIKWMDATGAVHTATPEAEPHLWRALAVSVGRLGIILEVTFGIVHNTSVRRTKTDATADEFLAQLRSLQEGYNAARRSGGSQEAVARAIWNVLRPWNEAQIFWHIPLHSAWLVTFEHFDNATAAPPPVSALDGPADEAARAAVRGGRRGAEGSGGDGGALPEGAFTQRRVEPVGVAPGMEGGALYWAGVYSAWLGINVQSETLPARQAYLSLSEMENLMYSPYNSYDQYEIAIPLSRAADCMDAFAAAVYGPAALWRGFRTPPLLRFVAGEPSFLAPSNWGATLYMNLEDHVGAATPGRPNAPFQAAFSVLRTHPACRGRMHWGKAGWPAHAACFDGAKEYGAGWCHFGCEAVARDPAGKFASSAGGDVWTWHASIGGARVERFQACCRGGAFDEGRCECAARPDCG